MTQDAAALVSPLTEAEECAVRTFYRAFSEKNLALLGEALAPDWQDIPLGPGQGAGPEGFKPLMQHFFTAFPDIDITVCEIISTRGRAGARSEITGTRTGEMLRIAPTGKKVSIALHEFHHLQDGLITHTWHLEDWFGMMRQVGAWPSVASVSKGK